MFFCPPQAENFDNLRHTSDDFPLENRVSEGQINCKCQKIACGALATTRCIVKIWLLDLWHVTRCARVKISHCHRDKKFL